MKKLNKIAATVIVTSLVALGGCSAKENKPIETEAANEAQEELTLSAYRSIDDYIKMPNVDFSVHYKPEPVRGVYVTASRAGGVRDDGTKYFDDLINIANTTPVNAMVIDIKDELPGQNVTVRGKIPAADELGLSKPLIPRPEEVMEKMAQNGIYSIARIVAFKDNALTESRPELYIKNSDGGIYYDNGGSAWLNPYNRETWEYNIDIAKGAAAMGFKEIQFDYIRFVADAGLDETNFGNTDGKSKEEIILDFARYAVEQLHPLGVKVSADVYGTVIGSSLDAGIVGQNYVELAKIVDVICPMVYPSHYAAGEFDVAEPDFEPYTMILKSMQLSTEKLSAIPEGEHVAIVRPWLQDFTASYLGDGNYQTYGDEQRREQIQAAYEAGISEWLMWDARVDYNGAGWAE